MSDIRLMPAVGALRDRPLLDFGAVLFVLGWLIVALAGAMLVPLLADLATGNADWEAFAGALLITLFAGVSLVLACRRPGSSIGRQGAFVLTSLSWLALCLFAALPFLFWCPEGGEVACASRLSLTDAVFEAVSGLTTTGATVLTGLDTAPPGILLWRGVLEWIGGLGINVMAMAVLPLLSVGGMQLFHTESSDRSDKVVPRVSALAADIGLVYVSLTVLCFLALSVAGMAPFDALVHALTTASTGGFSTRDDSVGGFANPDAEWVITGFIILSALPMVRFVSLTTGKIKPFWADSQIHSFLFLLALSCLAVSVWRLAAGEEPPMQAVREAVFNTTAVMTTTGFSTTDYSAWGPAAIPLFMAFLLVGGCMGSTTGSIKMFRHEILWLELKAQVATLISPSRVTVIRYNDKVVDAAVLRSVATFVFIFFGSMIVFSLALAVLGLEPLTAFSAAAANLSNLGPGLGPEVGPAGTYKDLPDAAKWVLMAAQLLGRLEFFTMLVLISPAFWRR